MVTICRPDSPGQWKVGRKPLIKIMELPTGGDVHPPRKDCILGAVCSKAGNYSTVSSYLPFSKRPVVPGRDLMSVRVFL